MQRVTGSFTATDDDGRFYTIEVLTDYVLNEKGERTPGPISHRTSDGQPVQRQSKGIYQIVASGLILRTDDSTVQ
jgi:hypothetical protein